MLKNVGARYTAEDLNARLRFIVGLVLAACLAFTMTAVLYGLLFVTQPQGEQSPNDKAFFDLITPIATFLVGTLSGVMIAAGPRKDTNNNGVPDNEE